MSIPKVLHIPLNEPVVAVVTASAIEPSIVTSLDLQYAWNASTSSLSEFKGCQTISSSITSA